MLYAIQCRRSPPVDLRSAPSTPSTGVLTRFPLSHPTCSLAALRTPIMPKLQLADSQLFAQLRSKVGRRRQQGGAV
jgi:hypothetical protein